MRSASRFRSFGFLNGYLIDFVNCLLILMLLDKCLNFRVILVTAVEMLQDVFRRLICNIKMLDKK